MISQLTAPGFLEGVRERGEYLRAQLLQLSEERGFNGERGEGLLRALLLDNDNGPKIVEKARDMGPDGLLLNAARPNLLRFMPALNVTKDEIDQMMSMLRSDPRHAVIIRVFDERDTQAVLALWAQAFPEYADAWQTAARSAFIDRKQARDAAGVVLRRRAGGASDRHGDGGLRRASRMDVFARGRRAINAATVMAARWSRMRNARLPLSGCPKLNLQIMANKPRSRAFYAKLGYQMDEVVSFGKRL